MAKIPLSVNFLCLLIGHQYGQDVPQCMRCGMPSIATIFEERTLNAYLADWLHWQLYKASKTCPLTKTS